MRSTCYPRSIIRYTISHAAAGPLQTEEQLIEQLAALATLLPDMMGKLENCKANILEALLADLPVSHGMCCPWSCFAALRLYNIHEALLADLPVSHALPSAPGPDVIGCDHM